ncbi:MAG: cysteine hydrolase [Firmicutes bacterium]|nr:cysteine hydrolase [Bacillota bacterium]MBR6473573.1 cysteine hydrolase [Bacillota bacterium]
MKVFCVIDMQNDFIDCALGTPEAVGIVDPVAEFIAGLDDDCEIVATRDTHYNDYLETNEGRHLPVVHCQIDSHGWEINERVAEALRSKGARIIDKPNFGISPERWAQSFENVDVTEIVLFGLCTDICVISNALAMKTAYPEIPVKVYSDLCAGVTPESHEAALLTMKMCQVDVMKSWEDK